MPPTATTNERTSVSQGVKLSPEAIPGTPATTGFKKLTSLGMTPTINPTVTAYKPMGQKYTTVTTLNREDSTWKMDGKPTYTEIVYALSSVLTEAEITPPGGTTSAAAGSRLMGANGVHWFFKPSATDADSPVSFTVYKGSIAAAERASFWRMGDFTLTYNRNDTTISGNAMGRALEAGMSMPGNEVQQVAVNATGGTFTLTYAGQTTTTIAYNATPAVVLAALEALSNIPSGALRVTQTVAVSPAFTYQIEFGGTLGETNVAQMTSTTTGLTGGTSAAVVTTVTPGTTVSAVNLIAVVPNVICVYAFATPQASISAVTNETAAFRLTDVMEVQLVMSGRYSPYYTLDCTQPSYAALIESEPTLQFVIKMQADSVGLGYLTQLRNGGTIYFRVKASGDLIAGTDFYELTYDFAGKITASSELADSDGVVSVTWTFDGTPTLTNGGPLEVVAVNNVTSL